MGKKYNNIDEYLLDTIGKDSSDMNYWQKKDAEIGLSAYKQLNNLEQTYNSAVSDLDKNLQENQRTAYYNNEKLLKYLPNRLKVNGLSGNVGANTQAYIDANNSYQSNLNSLNQNHNSQKTNLLNDYNSNVLKIEENARQERNSLDKEKRVEDKETSSDLLNSRIDKLSEYASQFNVNDDGEYSESDYNKILAYGDTLYNDLTDSDKLRLKEEIGSFRKQKTLINESTNDLFKTNKGETVRIDYNFGKQDPMISNLKQGILKELITKFGSKNSIPNGYIMQIENSDNAWVYYNGEIQFAKISY